MHRTSLGLGLCLLAGCGTGGGNTVDAGVDSGVPMPTMLSATGALTGMISAPKPTVGHDPTMNQSSFNLRKTSGAGLAFKVDFNFSFTGAPAPGTYSDSSAGFVCNATVTSGTAMNDTWVARFNSTAGGREGSCSLTLTSAAVGAQGYDVAGSLSVTGAPMGGAAANTVTVMGTF